MGTYPLFACLYANALHTGLNLVRVERCENPHLDDWVRLCSMLILHHQISGMRTFSRKCLAKQLVIPRMACLHKQTVGMLPWYVQIEVAYDHLGAYEEEGYKLRFSLALFCRAFDFFSGRGLQYANWGAGTGLGNTTDVGLSRFKRRWSASIRSAYLCGCIFDHQAYSRLARKRGIGPNDYFPAYRRGEFN